MKVSAKDHTRVKRVFARKDFIFVNLHEGNQEEIIQCAVIVLEVMVHCEGLLSGYEL